MCGIAGFTHRNRAFDSDRIQSAVNSLFHRGPDQQGVYQSEFVSLGATRLKIIDLDSGDQPIISETGDAVVVFNGEIYNHAELRIELEKRGHRFRTHSDTETILHAFLEWDTKCFARLRGMFAIALWTESQKRLIIARDRMGIKPLYIARRGGDLFFGSELKAILIHPEIDRRLSLDGLDCYLALNYVPSPWTLIDGVENLSPGTWLEWQNGKIASESYWALPYGPKDHCNLDSAKEQLGGLLQQSVSDHLISDVPLGIWLSGGVDSSTILHYASAASSSRLKTFSISFQGRSFDETAYIREAAAHYGTDHQEFDLNGGADLQDAIEEFSQYSDQPNADAGALPVWYLSKLTKRNATVVLSGEGADELFGGYLTHRANILSDYVRHVPPGFLRVALRALKHWPVSDEKISFEYKLKRFLEGCLMPRERAHVYWNGTFSDADKRAMLRGPESSALQNVLAELRSLSASGDGLSPYLWFDQKHYLQNDILMKTDCMSMAHSIEVRPPFLDHRIVEFAASLPANLKIRGSRQKFILKELMKDKLPQSILRRKKIGFDIPVHEWLRGPLRSLLIETLSAGVSEHSGLFRQSAIEGHLRRHLERRANLGYHLWGLMILFLWMKRWRIQSVPVTTLGQPVPDAVLTSI